MWNKLAAIGAVVGIVGVGLSILFWLFPKPTAPERSSSPIRISTVRQFGHLTDATTVAGCMTGDAYASVHGDITDARELEKKAAILAPTNLVVGIESDMPASDSATLLGIEINARTVGTEATVNAHVPLQLAFGRTACASGYDLDRSLQYRLVLDPSSSHYSFKLGTDATPLVPITLRSASTLSVALLIDARAAGLYEIHISVRYRYRGKDREVEGQAAEIYWPERQKDYRFFSYLLLPDAVSPLEELSSETADQFRNDIATGIPQGFPPALASTSVRSEPLPPP